MSSDGVPADHPSIIVMHHFLGSWKIRRPRDLLRFSVMKRFVLTVWQLFYPMYGALFTLRNSKVALLSPAQQCAQREASARQCDQREASGQ